MNKDEGYLCTTLCDCLLDFPRRRDEERTRKILAGLHNCYPRDEPIKGDTYWLDLRGRHIIEVESILGLHTHMMFFSYKRVNVRVGCNKHGVGEGKLKNAVIQILKRDSIDFTSEGCVVSIRRPGLEEEEEFRVAPAGPDSGTMGEKGVVKAVGDKEVTPNVDELCTITCDMLLGMPRYNWQGWDEVKDKEFIQKVLTALEKCNQCDDRGLDMKDNTIDLRGMYISDVTQVLVDRFSLTTGSGVLNLILGCKKHGIGDGNLKKTVISMLNMDKSIEVDDQGYFVTVKIEGRKDLRLIRNEVLNQFALEDLRVASERYDELFEDEGMPSRILKVNFDFMPPNFQGFVAAPSLKEDKMDAIIAQIEKDAITAAQIEKETKLEFVADGGVKSRSVEAMKDEQINKRPYFKGSFAVPSLKDKMDAIIAQIEKDEQINKRRKI